MGSRSSFAYQSSESQTAFTSSSSAMLSTMAASAKEEKEEIKGEMQEEIAPIARIAPPIPDIRIQSPIPIIGSLYNSAKTREEKEACLRYLLHYQHYNADFTEKENNHLHYPLPLRAPQEASTYVRTGYSHLFDLLWPWMESHFIAFFNKQFRQKKRSKVKNIVKISAAAAFQVLKEYFSTTHELLEARDSHHAVEEKGIHQKKNIWIVRLTRDDLKLDITAILKKQGFSTKNLGDECQFLFVFSVAESVDCLLLWGAKIKVKANEVQVDHVMSLDQLFPTDNVSLPNIFSLLSENGAAPDRLALNLFITYQLGDLAFKDAIKSIGIADCRPQKIDSLEATKEWQQFVLTIAKYRFKDDEGTEIYRDAILRWEAIVFKKNEALIQFAAPLLCTQVVPYCAPDFNVVQWQKGYQNLCEILLLCIEYFPDLIIADFHQASIKMLNSKNLFSEEKVVIKTGCYPYAMSATLDILGQLFNRHEYQQKPIITCTSSIYFETLSLLNHLYCQNRARISIVADSLDDIKKLPQILVADIHPNNASAPQQIQNHVAEWIRDKLRSSPESHLILVLDATINYLSDADIQSLLEILKEFVLNKQLEIYGVQSLAKLIQLGADNFSGGSCFYLGIPTQGVNIHFPNPIPQKAVFFGLLLENFQDLLARYFKKIRQNTEWLYTELPQMLRQVAFANKEIFCAVAVSFNYDAGTVYVAIHFQPFFKKIKKSLDKKEMLALIENLHQILINEAKKRNLPLTERPSFGFGLSAMVMARESLRFSVGVESQHLLSYYLPLLEDFSAALSFYTLAGFKDSEGFKIYFAEYLKNPTHRRPNPRLLRHIEEEKCMKGRIEDEKAGIIIEFPPFSATYKGKKYSAAEVFIDSANVPISRLQMDEAGLDDILFQFKQFYIEVESYQDGIRLTINEPKPHVKYEATIKRNFKTGGLKAVIDFLNGLPEPLPIPHDCDWTDEAVGAKDQINETLRSLGEDMAKSLSSPAVELIKNLVDPEYKKNLLKGLLIGLCGNPFRKGKKYIKNFKAFNQLIANPEFQSLLQDQHTILDGWVDGANDSINKNPSSIREFSWYLKMLIPLIKLWYPSVNSLGRNGYYPRYLYNLVELAALHDLMFRDLKMYLLNLLKDLPHAIARNQNAENLCVWVNIYLHYPLPPESEALLLRSLCQYSEEALLSWLQGTYFKHTTYDNKYLLKKAYDDYTPLAIISERDGWRFNFLLTNTPLLDILIKKLQSDPHKYLEAAFRIAIYTQNEKLKLLLKQLVSESPGLRHRANSYHLPGHSTLFLDASNPKKNCRSQESKIGLSPP